VLPAHPVLRDMLQRLTAYLRPTVEPVCPNCKFDMKGVNLIPGFAAGLSDLQRC
jgi:hypothetical protein